MRVLFPIGAFYPSQSGGPANSVYWLCKGLKKTFINPIIITTDFDVDQSIERDTWLELDCGTVRYTRKKVKRSIFKLIPTRLIYQSIRMIPKADALHLSMLFLPHDIPLILTCLFFKKPIIMSPRGSLDPPALKYSSFIKRIFLLFYKSISSKLIFHATCDEETRYIQNNFGVKTKIVQITNLMELPERITIPKKKNQLLYVGRIHHKKALHLLIEALSVSRFKNSEFTFVIAGDYDSKYGNQLVSQVKQLGLNEKVIFLGHKTGADKQLLFAESYFSFLVSFSENFGLTVIESMAQGTPVVTSTNTPWEILEKTKAGYWVENSVETLAKTIDEVLSLNDQAYRNLCEHSYELVKKEFDVYERIAEWQTFYMNLLTMQKNE